MTADEWDICDRHFIPRFMLDHVAGAESVRVRRLFAIALHLRGGYDPTSDWERDIVTIARRAADGQLSRDKLARHSRSAQRATGGLMDLHGATRERAIIELLDPELTRDVCGHWTLGEPLRQLRPDEMRSFNEWCRLSVELIRCVFGNPFTRVEFQPVWRTSTAVAIARGCHESGDYSAMPILADALQDVSCDDDIVTHCREPVHVRGCRVVDAVLGLR